MKTNTIYIFIISFVVLATSVTLIWFVREEIFKKIEDIHIYYVKEIQNKNLEFGNKLKDENNLLSKQEETIKKVFINSNSIVSFIKQLEFNAQSLNLNIDVQKIGYSDQEVVEQKYTVKPVTFTLELKGSLPQIESFITKVSELEQKLIIKELKLYKDSGKDVSAYTARIIIGGTILSYE